jgi:hypothetical protein
MNLSIRGLDELLVAVKGGEFRIVVILDPNSNRDLAEKVVKEHHWPSNVLQALQSRVLIKKGLRVHYPSYQYVAHGKITGPVIPGYKTPIELGHYQARYLK